MSLSKNMIQVKNFGGVVYEERTAGEAGIKPGMLCRVGTDGKAYKHNAEGGKCECLVAIEDSLQGRTVDDAYDIDTPVRLVRFRPGEEFHGLLNSHVNMDIGENVVSYGNGLFRSASDSGSYTAYAVAMVLEASAGETSDTLIHMRAL